MELGLIGFGQGHIELKESIVFLNNQGEVFAGQFPITLQGGGA